MNNKRNELHHILMGILGSGNVYYEPPPSVILKYPCIIYKHTNYNSKHANNSRYNQRIQWSVVVIDTKPNTTIHEPLLKLPFVSFDRSYSKDNLTHKSLSMFF